MNALERVGDYSRLMWKTFQKPDSWKMFGKQYVRELHKQGINSLPIVCIISVFIGAVGAGGGAIGAVGACPFSSFS